MNKHQLEYLTSKIRGAATAAISEYSKNHQPVDHSRETVAEALKEAGFIPLKNGFHWDDSAANMRNAAGYLTLPPTKEMMANRERVAAYTKAVNAAQREAIDAANLGSSSDALNILARFTETLKAL